MTAMGRRFGGGVLVVAGAMLAAVVIRVDIEWLLPLALVGLLEDGRLTFDQAGEVLTEAVVLFATAGVAVGLLSRGLRIGSGLSQDARRRLGACLLVALSAAPFAAGARAALLRARTPITAANTPLDSRALTAPVAGPGDLRCDHPGCSFRATCEISKGGNVVARYCSLHSNGCRH